MCLSYLLVTFHYSYFQVSNKQDVTGVTEGQECSSIVHGSACTSACLDHDRQQHIKTTGLNIKWKCWHQKIVVGGIRFQLQLI